MDINSKKKNLQNLERSSLESHFWDDSEKAQEIMIEINSLREIVNTYEELESSVDSIKEVLEIMSVEEFIEMKEELVQGHTARMR